jgi:hypothetical protein
MRFLSGSRKKAIQQQANATQVKEGKIRWRLKQETHSQSIAIESDCPLDICDWNGDLADLIQPKSFR